jgi:hypothetical protein
LVVFTLYEVTGEYNRVRSQLIPEDRISMAWVFRCALVFTLWALFSVGKAGAQKPEIFAQYEEQLIKKSLALHGLELDPAPEGKQIEQIYIDAKDIILPGDLPLNSKLPWTMLNRLHWRTRDYIVAQELLFAVGERYQRDLIEETERNLRGMFILAVAKVVAVRGSAKDRVGVLVVTKDRWTLRLNTNFLIDGTTLDNLSMSIAESNLLGRNKQATIEFSLDPGRYGVGASYSDPRIWSSRHAATLYGLFYLNRQSGQLEGGLLQFSVGRPLFSLRTRLSWQANVSYLQDIARFFAGETIALTQIGTQQLPTIYTRQNLLGNLQITYSDGLKTKANLTFAMRVVSNVYGLPSDFPTVSSSVRAAYVATVLPRSESWAGPVVNFETFTPHYIKLRNINTFALTEDFLLGPHLIAEVHFASHVFGLPSDFVEGFAIFNHLTYWHDNLFDYGSSLAARMQYSTAAAAGYGTPFVNESVTAYVREVTPRFGPLRLHIYGTVQLLYRDLNNTRLTLGSDNGLRGYEPRFFQGNDMYHVNVELRSLSLNLWTIHVGGVVFYDGGDAPAGFNVYDRYGNYLMAGFHQDAGFGVRILLPHFNYDVLRLDLGFPFETPSGGYVPNFSVAFGQAF